MLFFRARASARSPSEDPVASAVGLFHAEIYVCTYFSSPVVSAKCRRSALLPCVRFATFSSQTTTFSVFCATAYCMLRSFISTCLHVACPVCVSVVWEFFLRITPIGRHNDSSSSFANVDHFKCKPHIAATNKLYACSALVTVAVAVASVRAGVSYAIWPDEGMHVLAKTAFG